MSGHIVSSHPPHLQRLDRVWIRSPVYFLTTCTRQRQKLLATPATAEVLVTEWSSASERHGWHIGRYVIMPDHVHFFAAPGPGAKPLESFMAKWKEWTAKRILFSSGNTAPLWQTRFFDHLLRSNESLSAKWAYVRDNPVRAGLVAMAEEWRYQGSIHFE
ncbi:MAG TPA: transposase [Opitutaceae bacterium]|nr:transposase [Opitutaceae bacterium]